MFLICKYKMAKNSEQLQIIAVWLYYGRHDILEVVSDLGRCCSDALKIIQGFKSKVAVTQIEEELCIERERNTWRLIFILYQDRLLTQGLMEDKGIPQYCGRSEKLCMQNLFKRDNLVREAQMVIDWLESNAADRDDEALHFSDSTVGWENTLHQLQSADTIAFESSREIVRHLDPDAPHYEKKPLHDLDMEDERRLERKIFTEIRCGKLEDAQQLCRQSGHSWRAAMLEGWRLFHDPNMKETNVDADPNDEDAGFEDMEQDKPKDIEGNCNRDVWKNIAIKYCKQDDLTSYDKAAIASFCGYIEAMLPVCHTWEDNLWAYMKAMVDIKVESEIRDCVTRYKVYSPLPDEYWAQRMSLNELFSSLESSRNRTVAEEAKKYEYVIQKHIILDDIPNLLLKFEEWVEDDEQTSHFLRFLAHLVLFFDQIGHGHNREIVEKVLEIYIKRLMDMNETQLVAFYVSKLNVRNQVLLYAKYLEAVHDTEDRKVSLEYAENSGLNIFAITKQVVENIRNIPHDVEESGNLQPKLTPVDKLKISALDWVLFYEEQRGEALFQANSLMFAFLTLGKLDAAQLTFNKLPTDIIEKINAEDKVGDDLNQAVKEYLSYKAYLDAHEAFNEWFKHSKSKPMPPEGLPENAQFPEKVAHQHRESQYRAELERWKLAHSHLAKTAKTMLYNVLLFPQGWLVGAQDDEYIRSTCIPKIVLLLYTVLSETNQHEECVQLADILAAEKYSLYKVYSRHKLAEVLTKLAESSVALLNERKDPWGNETSA
ncbi:unnamed protein product [Acanthoscelides obtectus]|uniref:Nuclear pore complex protein n=1 Tax=Acanthoscelides obtectus TaxID=200917 RepID=A0A9P0LUF7_ACAOB|nr:unnamed protein product [Acanthoscelides obtectus]CAK1648253.1 Nuclear pore complex protein Nup107 [Acanthoscelides obtectus]